MGLSKTFEAYVGPIFKALSSVPILGWLPLVIVLAGIDEALKVTIIAIGCVVPVTINTFEGVRNVPRGLVEVAKVFQFNDFQLLRKVVLPAAAPSVYTGISLSISHAWKALVAVELMASSEGIGFLMVMGRQLFQLDVVLATIVVIGLVGLLLDQLLRLSERHFLRWRKGAIG
jgi:sulfonate transport system permease protein